MSSSLKKLDDDYQHYVAVCNDKNIKPLKFEEDFYKHLEELKK